MKNPNTCRNIMALFIIVGLLIFGISGIIFGANPIHPLGIIGAVIAFGSILYGILTIRCPFCHNQLRLTGFLSDEFCPYCGTRLK